MDVPQDVFEQSTGNPMTDLLRHRQRFLRRRRIPNLQALLNTIVPKIQMDQEVKKEMRELRSYGIRDIMRYIFSMAPREEITNAALNRAKRIFRRVYPMVKENIDSMTVAVNPQELQETMERYAIDKTAPEEPVEEEDKVPEQEEQEKLEEPEAPTDKEIAGALTLLMLMLTAVEPDTANRIDEINMSSLKRFYNAMKGQLDVDVKIASIVKNMDSIANDLESKGMLREAHDIDIISNTVELLNRL